MFLGANQSGQFSEICSYGKVLRISSILLVIVHCTAKARAVPPNFVAMLWMLYSSTYIYTCCCNILFCGMKYVMEEVWWKLPWNSNLVCFGLNLPSQNENKQWVSKKHHHFPAIVLLKKFCHSHSFVLIKICHALQPCALILPLCHFAWVKTISPVNGPLMEMIKRPCSWHIKMSVFGPSWGNIVVFIHKRV